MSNKIKGHTPAPWIASTNGEVRSEEGYLICRFYDNPGEEEAERNIALGSAAPELLKACRTALSHILGGPAGRQQAIEELDNAIAKVEASL